MKRAALVALSITMLCGGKRHCHLLNTARNNAAAEVIQDSYLEKRRCCADFKKNGKGSCSEIKRTAWQQDAIKPQGAEYHDHFTEFLDLAEQGKFDGSKTIYVDSQSSIGKGLMNTPANHWKSFSEEIVMQGPKDKPINGEKGKPQRILHIETKTGHKLTIHLVDPPTMEKMTTPQKAPPTISEKPLAIRGADRHPARGSLSEA